MGKSLKGILSAIVTPFDETGDKIDVGQYGKLIEWQIEAGIHGIIITGSTGEHAALSVDERKTLFEVACDAMAGKATAIAHVGSNNVRDTLTLTHHAKALGMDQLLVLPPYFDRLDFEETCRFLDQIVSVFGRPIILYDKPGSTGLELSEEQLVALRQNGLVSHIKDSSASFTRTMRLLANERAPTVLAGSDPALLAVLLHGSPGTIIGASSLVPELCVELYQLIVEKGDSAGGLAIWQKLWPILDFMLRNGYVPLAKAGLAWRGLAVGHARPPQSHVDEQKWQRFEKILRQSGITPFVI